MQPRAWVHLIAAASFSGLLADISLAGGDAGADKKAPDAATAESAGTAGSNKKPEGSEAKGGDPAAQTGKSAGEAKYEGGRWMMSSGEPTYKISEDGTVDWATYEGFKRYHAECHTCHGPNGLGSTFAPALADSMKSMNYEQYKEVVANGKASGDKAMPAFANNPNVMCYVDSIYVYLKARADGALKAGEEAIKQKVAKSDEVKSAEQQCMQ